MKLIFATNNKHKLLEATAKFHSSIALESLSELGFTGDIEETADTIEGNAKIKAEYIHNLYGVNCFADDTGLEVDALGGVPGVYSSRYAGEHATYQDNVNKLLKAMQNEVNRKARFRTCIYLILNNKHYTFEGMVNGKIIDTPFGTDGFGYDPVFVPDGYDKTFAELPLEVKNKISHRGLALDKLAAFLLENSDNK